MTLGYPTSDFGVEGHKVTKCKNILNGRRELCTLLSAQPLVQILIISIRLHCVFYLIFARFRTIILFIIHDHGGGGLVVVICACT